MTRIPDGSRLAVWLSAGPETRRRPLADGERERFLAAYDSVAERVIAEVVAACRGEDDWLDRVRAGLSAVLRLFALDPELARAAIVDVQAAGADARRRYSDALGRLGELLEDGREAAAEHELPDDVALMATGAVSGLIFDRLLAGEAEALPELLPDLLYVLLVPYLGPRAAAEQMERAAAG